MSVGPQRWGLVLFIAVCYAAAAIGFTFTTPAVRDWYATLSKPAWTPADWVFAPVWMALYTIMAVAAWLVWRKRGVIAAAGPLALFAVQLVLNVGWSALFFGLRLPDAAFAEIILLWLAVLATAIAFWRVTLWAGLLMLPYLLWVTFAAVLNFAIWGAMT